MRQGVVNGGDARVVLAEVAGVETVGAVRHRGGRHAQLLLQRRHQRLHDILTEALALRNDVSDLRRDD